MLKTCKFTLIVQTTKSMHFCIFHSYQFIPPCNRNERSAVLAPLQRGPPGRRVCILTRQPAVRARGAAPSTGRQPQPRRELGRARPGDERGERERSGGLDQQRLGVKLPLAARLECHGRVEDARLAEATQIPQGIGQAAALACGSLEGRLDDEHADDVAGAGHQAPQRTGCISVAVLLLSRSTRGARRSQGSAAVRTRQRIPCARGSAAGVRHDVQPSHGRRPGDSCAHAKTTCSHRVGRRSPLAAQPHSPLRHLEGGAGRADVCQSPRGDVRHDRQDGSGRVTVDLLRRRGAQADWLRPLRWSPSVGQVEFCRRRFPLIRCTALRAHVNADTVIPILFRLRFATLFGRVFHSFYYYHRSCPAGPGEGYRREVAPQATRWKI